MGSHLTSRAEGLIYYFVFVHSPSFRLALPKHYRVPVLALAHVHGCNYLLGCTQTISKKKTGLESHCCFTWLPPSLRKRSRTFHYHRASCLMSSAVTRVHPDTCMLPYLIRLRSHLPSFCAVPSKTCPLAVPSDLYYMEATMRAVSSMQASCSYTVHSGGKHIGSGQCRPSMPPSACRTRSGQRAAAHVCSCSGRTLCPG